MRNRNTDKTISNHRHKTLLAAEKFAKAFRAYYGQAVCEQTREQFDYAWELHSRWMRLAGSQAYIKPQGFPEPVYKMHVG